MRCIYQAQRVFTLSSPVTVVLTQSLWSHETVVTLPGGPGGHGMMQSGAALHLRGGGGGLPLSSMAASNT